MLVIKELCALLLTYSLIAFARGFEFSNSSYLQQMMNIRKQKVEEINNYKEILQKVGGKDCSYGLTISSSGPAGRIQGRRPSERAQESHPHELGAHRRDRCQRSLRQLGRPCTRHCGLFSF